MPKEKMPQALIDKWNKGKKAPVKGKAKGVKAGGLTAKQKSKLPPALQKAILKRKGK